MPSYGTTSLLNNVSNQKINHSGHIFQCLGHKLNEKLYCHSDGWSYGPDCAVWDIFCFSFSLKSEKAGKI